MKRIAVALSVLFVSYHCIGQVDSTYIGPFKQEFSVSPFVYYQFTSLSHEINDDREILYMPNSPVGIGVAVAYKNFLLSGGYAFGFMRNKERGETRAIDFQYHYYGRKFVLDLFFQNYKGLYVDDDGRYTTYPDIKLIQYGALWQYVFGYKRFSYRAAFIQSEQQLKSAGSLQVGGGIYFNQIHAEGSLSLNEQNTLNSYQLGVNGGYAYTWVIKKDYFVSGGVSVGVNVGTESLSYIKDVEVSPSALLRGAAGYNGNGWSLGVSAVINRLYVSNNDNRKMLFNTGYMQLNFIKRFDIAPNFLKKAKFIN